MRKKILVLSLVFVLFTGAFSFAQTSFLESWYNSLFQKTEDKLSKQLFDDLNQMDEDIDDYLLSTKNSIFDKLIDFTLLTSLNGQSEIKAYQQAQIDKLEKEKDRLEGDNFSEWKEEKVSMITSKIDEDMYDFLGELLND